MARVFISYRSLDRTFAMRLAQSLKDAGHDVWIDQWRITGRDPYWYEIQNGIQICTHFIFVITPDSISRAGNNGALKELFHAVGLQQPPILVPVVGKETPYNQLPMVITPGMYQIHDFILRPYDEALHSVLTALDSKTVTQPLAVFRESGQRSVTVGIGNARLGAVALAILIPIILIAIAAGFLLASRLGSPTPTALFTGTPASNPVLIGAASTEMPAAQPTATEREASTQTTAPVIPTATPVPPTATPVPPTATIDFQATADTSATQAWSQVLGQYQVDGRYSDGSPYSGTLVISPNGAAYRLDYTLLNASIIAVGVKIDDFLAVGYGANCGIMLYKVQPDRSLYGLFVFGGVSGSEIDLPASLSGGLADSYQTAITINRQTSSQYFTLTVADQNGGHYFTWSNGSEGFSLQNDSMVAVVYGPAAALPNCGVILFHIQPDGSLLGQYHYGNGDIGTENEYR